MTESKLAAALGLAILFALCLGAGAIQKQPSSAETAQDAAAVRREHRAIDQAREAIAAPAKSAPAPETDEYRIARGFAITVAYHVQCAKIPTGLQTAAGMAVDKVPLPIRNAAMDEVSAAIRTLGAAKFCATYGMDVARMVMSGR